MRCRAMQRVAFGLAVVLSAAAAAAENWPQWRGPDRDGISHETNLPVSWSATENVAWRLPLPGPAGATPIVWDDRIFLTSVDGDALLLLCVSTAGDVLWSRKVDDGNRDVRVDEGNSASPSPSTDGRHVWTFMTTGALRCYSLEGEELWHVDLQQRYGRLNIQFGMTSTPVLYGDRLYLQLIHGDGDPATREALVIALEKETGKEVWRHSRASDAVAECEQSYASPAIYADHQQQFLLTHGADYIVAHSLADGGELWRCGGLNPAGQYNRTLRFVASPLAVPGLIVVPSAKNGPVLGLRPDLHGDITNSREAYFWRRAHNTPDVPSPLVKDHLVYLCRENGNLICLDARSGKEYYQERTHRGRHRASPVYADGKIYLTARDGMISVIKHGEQFERLARNDMGEPTSASLAIANGRIYVRTFAALYAIERP